jgi:hypothetical protein
MFDQIHWPKTTTHIVDEYDNKILIPLLLKVSKNFLVVGNEGGK